MHVEQVRGILGRPAWATSAAVRLPRAVLRELGAGRRRRRAAYDERHHNCSGKHSGFLAYCVQHGQPTESYVAPGHPLQQAIRRDVAAAVGPGARRPGDGHRRLLGAQLRHAAVATWRAASHGWPAARRDAQFGASFASCPGDDGAHPDLVSGTGRNDVAFMRAGRGDWVTKVGADGVQVVASRSRGQALALKIATATRPRCSPPRSKRSTSSAGWTRAARGAAALARRGDLQRARHAGGRAQGGVPAAAAWHWHGKRFDGDEHVHPLVMRSVRGARWHLDPLWANLALPLLLRWPWLKSPTAGRLAWPVLPVLGTRRSRARLRLLEHRGRLTAAMLYDMLPAHDVFRRVDADTVLGAMDWKGLERPLFFVLRRERPSRDSGAR
jgi:hypothetical protein